MADSTHQPRFQCPRCLAYVTVEREQAGSRIACPGCGISLTVPDTIGKEQLFDDLFDDPAAAKSRTKQKQPGPAQAAPAKARGKSADRPERLDRPAENDEPNRADESEHPDPFQQEDSGPLRIEGISDNILAKDAFYFSCPICDSKIQVVLSQVGETVKCTDCHSPVKILKPRPPKTKPDPWRQAATMKPDQSAEDGFSLAPPVERPKSHPPLATGYGLDEVQADLLAPPPAEPADNVARDRKPARWKKQPVGGPAIETGRAGSQPRRAPQPGKIPRKSFEQQIRENSWNHLFQQIRSGLSGDLDLIIRTIVTVVFLSFSDVMIDYVWATLSREDLNGGESFIQLFPALLGSVVCLFVGCWFLAVTFSVLMRSFANGQKQVEEWVGFSPSEWIGNLAAVVVSLWAALLPGVLLGFVFWKLSGWSVFLPALATVSSFALLPLFMISSFYNESAVNIYSPDILDSAINQPSSWRTVYLKIGIVCLVFLAGILLTWIPGLVFSLIGAALQTLSISLFAVVIGNHAHRVIETIQAGTRQ